MTELYPISAVVGLDDLRLALLLNAVSPAIGGVLVRGEKGTAKSTVVRGLAAILPEITVVDACRFACDPTSPDPECPDGPHGVAGAAGRVRRARLVELPVGATEDRLVGSLDVERALAHGVAAYEPGLLAAAHRGLLYVDEVNLLHDHLVDVLLDAAAMGVAHVEREGVSVRHAARFLLVGTMNPEEGELRPQLLDRFGLTVEVRASREPAERAEVVRRRLAYEADPGGFAARWRDADADLARRIESARALLPAVELPDAELIRIARVCADFEVDGLRADIVTARAATALAAWHGRTRVTADDVRQAALLALPHRRRRNPFDAPGLDPDRLDEALRDADPEQDPDPPGPGAPSDAETDGAPGEDGSDGAPADGEPRADDARTTPPMSAPALDADPARGDHDGRAEDAAEAGRDAADRNSEDRDSEDRESGNRAPGNSDAEDRNSGERMPGAGAAIDRPPSAADAPYRTRLLSVPGTGDGTDGRRSRARTLRGRTVGATRDREASGGVHLPATVRAAAPHQRARGREDGRLLLRPDDLRRAVREGREGNLVLFVVDASGSMAARARMGAVKGAVLSLLLDAYQRRDKVGVVTFRGAGAEVALPPTWSVEVGAARLAALPTGGRTPLAAGLLAAYEVLRVERLRDPRRRPLLVVVTDGRATQALPDSSGERPDAQARRAAGLLAGTAAVVLDCESGPVRLGLAARLAADLGAELVPLSALASGRGALGGAAGGAAAGGAAAGAVVRGAAAGAAGSAAAGGATPRGAAGGGGRGVADGGEQAVAERIAAAVRDARRVA